MSVTVVLGLSLLSAVPNPQTRLRDFFNAVRQVEAGGQPNGGRDAVGKDGEIGPYQITRAYWQDSGVPGRFEQVKDTAYAERVMLAYWKRYCGTALRNLDFKTLARIHNGGPHGLKIAVTLTYWQRVQDQMRK